MQRCAGATRQPVGALVEVHQQVTRRLAHPRTTGMRGDPDQMHSAALKLDDEQHVQPGQADRLHGQEITRQHAAGLRPQERRPAQPATPRRRPQPVAMQDPSHRRRRHPHAELAALPHDPYVAPPRVLPRHPHHQINNIRGQPLLASSDGRIRPATRHQLAMPPQQRPGRDQKDRPALPRQQLRQHGQHQPIGRLIARPCNLPADHHQLVAQHGYLHIPGIRRRTKANQAQNAPEDHERQHAEHHNGQPARRE